MKHKEIDIHSFCTNSIDIWFNKWFLLTAGDFENANSMTISWGTFGGLWERPVVQVFARPIRYTYEFLNNYGTFTICAFPDKYKNDLQILGNQSGRDSNKVSETNLHFIKSSKIPAPAFQEAELIIECRKLYWQDLDPHKFLDVSIEQNYPKKDYHRMFIGEILAIHGIDKYKK